MNLPGPAALAAAVPRPEVLGDVEIVVLALFALALTGLFALLRSALLHSVPSRLLEQVHGDAERERLEPLLARAEALATSASILEITSEIFFVVLTLGAIGEELTAGTMGLALAALVPLLVLVTEVVPSALRGERSDRLLLFTLPGFDILQRPLAAIILALEGMRRLVMRLFRVPDRARSARSIVEGIRNVIEDSERENELLESEREIIENVVEFYDVDVAEVMTPRTEVTAVGISEGVAAVVRAIAKSGHSRIPVFERNLDRIVGIAYAQHILQVVSEGSSDDVALADLLQPVGFVPETKLVSELLGEFRRDRRKTAVVLDEYGGTAGIVTLSDIIAELVGEVREELGEPLPERIRRRADGSFEIHAGLRISELNEELDLDLPDEEDFDTVAGFVLSRMGRFPKAGEKLEWNGIEIEVLAANDRRVLEVLFRRPAATKLS